MRPLRIAIGCSSLCRGIGGTERAAACLAAEMADRGHFPLILSFGDINGQARPSFPLARRVRHLVFTDDEGGWHEIISGLRDFLMADQTDVFLSMQSERTHLFWEVACMGTGIPFIMSERTDPAIYSQNRVWNIPGRMAAIAGADCVHELLSSHAAEVPRHMRHKVRVIPNAGRVFSTSADPRGPERKKLLYLARMAESKRPLILLDAFRLIMDKYPDWSLEMWGEGPKSGDLREAVAAGGLGERVKLCGLCMDVEAAYSGAQIYCLPSAYEGFPNAVLEAMRVGLPIAGFQSCAGLANVARHGETAILASEDSPQSLAAVLDTLMSDGDLRGRLGGAAKKASALYAPEIVYGQWERLFYEMAALKGDTEMNRMRTPAFEAKAALSAAARREWLGWEFGEPMPYTWDWWRQRGGNVIRRLRASAKNSFKPLRCQAD